MEATYQELYGLCHDEKVEEIRMPQFNSWLKWYITNKLVHVLKGEDGKIKKVIFLRRLDQEDINLFPDYLHPDLPNVNEITKFYVHRTDGKVFYCELLIDTEESIDDLKMENLQFAFEWAKTRFNISNITDEMLLFYKKGNKINMPLKEIEALIVKILNYNKG